MIVSWVTLYLYHNIKYLHYFNTKIIWSTEKYECMPGIELPMTHILIQITWNQLPQYLEIECQPNLELYQTISIITVIIRF